jgi:hypothetical protein
LNFGFLIGGCERQRVEDRYVLDRRRYERERVDFAAFHSLTLAVTRNKTAVAVAIRIPAFSIPAGVPLQEPILRRHRMGLNSVLDR